jgi:hypothetical protein
MAYASKYYDPVKAHNYYMEHRKLKGRRGTLNDTGKEALSYVKQQLKEQRDKELEAAKKAKEQALNVLQSALNSIVQNIQKRLESGNLSAEQKKALKSRISGLKTIYTRDKRAVNETYRTKVKTAREKYKKEVEAETDKVYANYTKAKSKRG